LAGTLAASLGNITAVRNQRHGLPVVQQNAFGMLYGGLLVTLFALFTGQKFVFEYTVPYSLSLYIPRAVWLRACLRRLPYALGTHRRRPGRLFAVAIPIVAVLLSTFLEGFHWHPATVLGIAAVRARQCAGIAQKGVVRSGKGTRRCVLQGLEVLWQVRFELQHRFRIRERGAGHDENVSARSPRCDLGGVQADP